MTRHAGRLSRAKLTAVAGASVVALLLGGCSSSDEETPQPSATSDVGVQLFQWTWNAIAEECTSTLGPAGYGWVLTSPPQEHILGDAWWTHYQPVSYQIESRLGTRDEFAAMVTTCNEAGVEIYADAVINHMTGQNDPGVGWAGSEYEHYNYPGIYTEDDFHYCGTPDDDIWNYRDAFEVHNCELVNLADLATGTDHVRETVSAYLEDLVSLGVTGLRIDAAKHMPAEDVEAIVSGLPDDVAILQEVIRGAGEPIQPEDYLEAGDVYEFTWGRDMRGLMRGTAFRMYFRMGSGGHYASSDQAISFVDNHDTERNGETLTYKDAERYELAVILTLAHPYGTPAVMSGYAFSERDTGAFTDADGAVIDAQCGEDVGPRTEFSDGDWVCQHRWPGATGMLGWRAAAGDAEITDQWDEARDAIAFGREDKAFLIANRAHDPISHTWQTSLPAGTYCNVAAGPVDAEGNCSGGTVEVDANGQLTAEVPGLSALAIHVIG